MGSDPISASKPWVLDPTGYDHYSIWISALWHDSSSTTPTPLLPSSFSVPPEEPEVLRALSCGSPCSLTAVAVLRFQGLCPKKRLSRSRSWLDYYYSSEIQSWRFRRGCGDKGGRGRMSVEKRGTIITPDCFCFLSSPSKLCVNVPCAFCWWLVPTTAFCTESWGGRHLGFCFLLVTGQCSGVR